MATKYISAAGGATYADANSVSTPCTLALALAATYGGNTHYVADGAYSGFTLSKAGTAGAYSSFIASGDAAIVTSTGNYGVTISANYVRLEGFKVTGATYYGVYVTGNYDQIVGNEIYGNGDSGIYLNPRIGHFINGNTIRNNLRDGISVFNNSTLTISNNTIYQNRGDGIESSGVDITINGNTLYDQHEAILNHSDGIVVQGPYYRTYGTSTTGIVISNNIIYDIIQQIYITGTAGADGCTVDGVEVYGNVLYTTDATSGVNGWGIALDVSNDVGGVYASDITNVNIHNNTVVGIPYGAFTTAQEKYGCTYSYLTVKDNIFSHGVGLYVNAGVTTVGWDVDNNLYYRSSGTLFTYGGINYTTLAAFNTATGFEDNGISSDPLFADASAYDYHLLSGSPALAPAASDGSYIGALNSGITWTIERRVV